MRKLVAVMALLMASGSLMADDWRRSADPQTKVDNLVSVMPNTAQLMMSIGERYRDLYWAGKLERWEFAEYQKKELIGIVNRMKTTRPGRAEAADIFLDAGFEGMDAAIEQRDWQRFSTAFENMRAQCMVCHVDSGYGFITIPATPSRSTNLALE